MKANVEFEFNNVGQGLFYTGEIDDFNFVYDCGSWNEVFLKSAIRAYKKRELQGKPLDLLIISHLDSDHVNGLNDLLHDAKANTVILPYFNPLERLILALQRIDLDEWYYDFLADPISFLIEREVKRIIVIGGAEEGVGTFSDETPPPATMPPPPSEKSDRTDRGEKMDIRLPHDQNLLEFLKKNEPRIEKFTRGNIVQTRNHYGFIKVLGAWVFRFFNYKVSETKLSNFKDCLTKKNIDFSSLDSIIRIIKDACSRRKMKDCYRLLNKNLNDTSLVVYHGPVSRYKGVFRIHSDFLGKSVFYKYLNVMCLSPVPSYQLISTFSHLGQLLTGDISLNYKRKFGEFVKHYSTYFDTVLIFQLPHHGAKRSWNTNILNEVKNCHLWISSSGFSNRYGHPHISVVSDILNIGQCFACNNEFNKVAICGKIEW
jgi:hypothetical protein